MDDVILQELKRVAEQAVRPVRATITRKRRMRKELLAHLTAIFDEEAEKLGDEQAALEQAKQRFGDPDELTTQRQQAVPRQNRWRSILENMGYRPSESAWHLAVKHFVAILPILLLTLPTSIAAVVSFAISWITHSRPSKIGADVKRRLSSSARVLDHLL